MVDKKNALIFKKVGGLGCRFADFVGCCCADFIGCCFADFAGCCSAHACVLLRFWKFVHAHACVLNKHFQKECGPRKAEEEEEEE